MFKSIQRNQTTNKTFDYSKGDTRLSFTLRVDNNNQLKDFLELLKVAQKDIELELTPTDKQLSTRGSGFGEDGCSVG